MGRHEDKGHRELIDAMERVVTEVPHARLVLVGSGDGEDALRERARRSPAAGAIRFTGFVDAGELERLYATSAVFALPSRQEGFGLVHVEAMRHGLPCVASIHDAAPEVVGEGGVLVDLEDPGALAGALIALLRDPGRRRAIGELGRARALERFTEEAFHARLRALIEEQLERIRHRGDAAASR